MGIHIGMVRARAQVCEARRMAFETPANSAGLARRHTPITAAQAKAQPAADVRGLDRIGWAFSTATLIVWAIAFVLVRAAAP